MYANGSDAIRRRNLTLTSFDAWIANCRLSKWRVEWRPQKLGICFAQDFASLDSRVNDNACNIDNSDARRYQLLCESALKLADVSDKIACDLFTKQKSSFFEFLSSILEASEVKIGQNKALEFSKRAVRKCGNIQTGSKKFEFWPIKPIRMCASLLTRNSQGARNSIRAWLKFSVSWHLPAANFAPLLNAFGGGLKLFVL